MIDLSNHARRAVATLLTLAALAPRPARAQASTEATSTPAASTEATSTPAASDAAAAPAPKPDSQPGGILSHGGGLWYRGEPPYADPDYMGFSFEPQKNSLVALVETVGTDLVMWQFGYWAGNEFSKISTHTIADNFSKGWIVDTDPYFVNQFGHPLEGSFFYTAARSTGHNFYESFGFSFLGSLIWECCMEVQSASVNDQIMTPIGGTLLGEVLYRLHRLILDSGGAKPDLLHEVGAFLVSPLAGFNRLVSGDKYRGNVLLPPSWWGHFTLGAILGGSSTVQHGGAPAPSVGPWVTFGAHVVYGVASSPELTLRKPFDHFDLDFSFSFAGEEKPMAALRMRGTLLGDTINRNEGDIRGLWGLFASYDVTGVPTFKASGVGIGPGLTLRKAWGGFLLIGSVLGEFMPWCTGGSQDALFDRDYHVGPGLKGTIELRARFGDRVTIDTWAREYYVSGAYATGSWEDLTYFKVNLTLRIWGPHGVSGAVTVGRRHGSFNYQPEVFESAKIWAVYYTLLGGY